LLAIPRASHRRASLHPAATPRRTSTLNCGTLLWTPSPRSTPSVFSSPTSALDHPARHIASYRERLLRWSELVAKILTEERTTPKRARLSSMRLPPRPADTFPGGSGSLLFNGACIFLAGPGALHTASAPRRLPDMAPGNAGRPGEKLRHGRIRRTHRAQI